MIRQKILNKILILFEAKEEIEYVSFEKNQELSVIVLTNQRIIYTNKKYFEKDIFYFFEFKNKSDEVINRFKKTLQSDYDIESIIKKYFNSTLD